MDAGQNSAEPGRDRVIAASKCGDRPPKKPKPRVHEHQGPQEATSTKINCSTRTHRGDRLEREIQRAMRRCVARFVAGQREQALLAFDEAKTLIARRSPTTVRRIERERGLQ